MKFFSQCSFSANLLQLSRAVLCPHSFPHSELVSSRTKSPFFLWTKYVSILHAFFPENMHPAFLKQPWAALYICCCLVALLFPTLVTLQTAARQTPLSVGFPRRKYWSGLPLPTPRGLPDPRMEPVSPAWQADSLPPSTWEAGPLH